MLCTVFDFGDCSIYICLLYCIVFVCWFCLCVVFSSGEFHVRLLYDRICGPTKWYANMCMYTIFCQFNLDRLMTDLHSILKSFKKGTWNLTSNIVFCEVQKMLYDIWNRGLSGHFPSYLLKYITLYLGDNIQNIMYYVSINVVENVQEVFKFK